MMNPIPDPSLWRSFRFKALLVATVSVAVIIAVLFAISTQWIKRERLAAEEQRAQIMLTHLASSLRFGLTVQSSDLMRPVLQSALIAQEVRAVAVYDRAGIRVAMQPEATEPSDALPNRARTAASGQLLAGLMNSSQNHWILAARIDKETSPAVGAAPADFEVIPSDNHGAPIGTVWVYWDLSPGTAWLTGFQRRFLAFSAVAFLIVGVPTWMMTLYLSRGVSQLLVATQHVQRGNLSYRIHSERADELGDVMRAFDCMIARTAETTRQLQEERARALDASKAKSDFLANMSHELRTPLNAIVGFSELMLERTFGSLTDKQRSYVTDIFESGKHLLSLINDILDLAKIESGRMYLEPGPVDLPRIVTSCTRLISERASRHGLALQTNIEPGLTTINADERKLKQLIFNLLSNAVKFTRKGGEVGIDVRRREEWVHICVWDTGIGISAVEQARVFEEFYQVENSQVKRHQGTGLGLALVKKIAELHGGRVWVESAVDQGSRFCVEFPQPLRPAENLAQVA
jgi:signal transduction histidine kinase